MNGTRRNILLSSRHMHVQMLMYGVPLFKGRDESFVTLRV